MTPKSIATVALALANAVIWLYVAHKALSQ